VVTRLAIGAAILAVAMVVAWWLRRRRRDAPTRDLLPVPRQLDRSDFARPDAAWLVAYFSSATCASCVGLGPKVAVLESSQVSVSEHSFESARAIHERYDISAIPMILVADAEGVVHRAFVGAITATDLWAAVAEVRSPGSTPESDLGAL
jgi:hypothetical protein